MDYQTFKAVILLLIVIMLAITLVNVSIWNFHQLASVQTQTVNSTSNCKLKLYAWYFPSFYEFKENSASLDWTEWSLVKNAPMENKFGYPVMKPMNNNYYDLRNIKSRIKHRHLAHKYGIDGFAIYHYWFENHPVLNEVTELRLIDSEPDIEFHLMFVNEDWKQYPMGIKRDKFLKVLYDTPDKHAIYLLPFFLHPKYTKIDNKPVFGIYKYKELPIDYVDKLNAALRKYSNGRITQLHIMMKIKMNYPYLYDERASSMVLFAPHPILRYCHNKPPRPLNRTNEAIANNIDYFGGILTGWDPTPRYPHGNHTKRGKAVTGCDWNNVHRFEKYVETYIRAWINTSNNTRHWFYIFAWNEWGEGAVLEPNSVTGEQKGLIIHKIKKKICQSMDEL